MEDYQIESNNTKLKILREQKEQLDQIIKNISKEIIELTNKRNKAWLEVEDDKRKTQKFNILYNNFKELQKDISIQKLTLSLVILFSLLINTSSYFIIPSIITFIIFSYYYFTRKIKILECKKISKKEYKINLDKFSDEKMKQMKKEIAKRLNTAFSKMEEFDNKARKLDQEEKEYLSKKKSIETQINVLINNNRLKEIIIEIPLEKQSTEIQSKNRVRKIQNKEKERKINE